MPRIAESPINRLEVLPNDMAFYSNGTIKSFMYFYTFSLLFCKGNRAWNSFDTTRIFWDHVFYPSNCELSGCVCRFEVLTGSSHPFYQHKCKLWGRLISSSSHAPLSVWKVFWCVLDLIFFLNMDINTVSTSFIFRLSELLFYFCISLHFLRVLNWDL